jgi:hypothetical protein
LRDSFRLAERQPEAFCYESALVNALKVGLEQALFDYFLLCKETRIQCEQVQKECQHLRV